MVKYVEILFRHRLRFLILLFILPGALAGACVFLFPHETAASALWVDTPAYIDISPSVQGWNQYLTPAQNTVDALDQLRGTDAFSNTLRSKLDAMNTFHDSSERNSVMSTAATDMVITATGSHLVSLNYICPRQPVCTNVLAATEDIYRQWLADQQSSQAKVATDFYTGQLTDAQAKLTTDQNALADYLAAHPNVRATDTATIPQFDLLTRNVDNDLLKVADLQQKLDNIRLTNAAVSQTDETVLKVIDAPHTVGGRLNALPKKQMLIAAAIGLAIALGMLFFMAWTDRTVREARDLETFIRIPVVVTIPDLALTGASDG
ncbi:MAG TPA: hypothetical protein VGG90_11265 [Candidatus Dormibacteraeota bacterium]